MEDRLVSVIVPVYNVEDYINKCVKTIQISRIEKLRLYLLMMDRLMLAPQFVIILRGLIRE